MKLYLDMCALKRPYDDQTQDRIWLESVAIIRVLQEAPARSWTIMNSEVLLWENDHNPKPVRRARTAAVLQSFGTAHPVTPAVLLKAGELVKLGIRDIDALHVGCAWASRAACFITCDDQILKLAKRHRLLLPILTPVDFIREYCL